MAHVIVTPQLYERARRVWQSAPFLVVTGTLQSQQGVVSVKAGRVHALPSRPLHRNSRDFH